ncbi:MAG: peptidoglycan editing factor PgeF, partial [Pseudomonadota bacterium]
DDQSPPTADAMVTATKGIAIAVLTADCMPVQFLDERAGIIGAAHAGWKGALAGILENTVKAMAELGSKAGDIRACIGPCLRPPNFEIGDDLYAAFVSKHPQSAAFFSPMNEQGKRQFDLVAFGRWRLSELGVDAVDLVGGCTLADPERYFSYRWARKHGQENYGRNLSAIALV